MVNKKVTVAGIAAIILAAAAFQVGCGDDDETGQNNPDTGTLDTGAPDGGGEGGQCQFNDFVLNLINTQTTATATPSPDLGDNCADPMTPFPATTFQ